MKKKRIHEVTYAQNVINAIKPDVENIKLNENLFHAQQMAKHSTTLIKDIQKDVRLTLKKYDSFVKMSESNRRDKMISDSARKYQSESPQRRQQSAEKELETLRQQQKLLMSLLNNLQQQEKILTSQTIPSPQPYPNPIADKNWLDQKQKQLQQLQKGQILTESISPKKIDKSDVIQIDLSKVKRSPNSKNSTAQQFFSPTKNQVRNSMNYLIQSYSKIHHKQSNSPDKWGQYGLIDKSKTQKYIGISKRNEQWKQRVDNKIKNELIKKQEMEIQACTFKPKILTKSQKITQNSGELSNDLNEIMYLIDDLNEFNGKLKRSTVKK